MKSRSFTFGEQTAAWKNRQKVTRENTVRSNQFHPDKSRQRVCWTLICGQDEHRVPFLWPCPAFLRLSISSVHQIHALTQCSNTHKVLFPHLFFCDFAIISSLGSIPCYEKLCWEITGSSADGRIAQSVSMTQNEMSWQSFEKRLWKWQSCFQRMNSTDL